MGKKLLVAIPLTIIVLLGGYWGWKTFSPRSSNGAARGREAPDFELKDASGGLHTLTKDAAGAPVIVHFWASWCPPCLEEIPVFLDFARKNADSGVKFIAVSLDKSWADAEKILPAKSVPADMVSVIDTELKVSEKFGSFQFPETYFLDRRHRIVAKFVGGQKWDDPGFGQLIEALRTR